MKLLVIGDSHGDADWLESVIAVGAGYGCRAAVLCGDFGLWTHETAGHVFLDQVQDALSRFTVNLFVVGGNHENWDHWNVFLQTGPHYRGFALVRSRILLSPKVNYWTWEGKKFLAVGGAVSVDKDYRLEREKALGPRTMWWPDEQLSDEDLTKVRAEKVDYLFTHDCSDRTPWGYRLKDDSESKAHRQKIDTVLSRATPDLQFHGHMHEKYDWVNMYGDTSGEVAYTQTYGLDRDGAPDSWGVLDVETGDFTWATSLAL